MGQQFGSPYTVIQYKFKTFTKYTHTLNHYTFPKNWTADRKPSSGQQKANKMSACSFRIQ